ncbi:monooxygenase 1-like [Durio zibethinus]|uniref:Monooxygenase 1-like n=1 Tax=Durio zibethinus TaxID=66656 RepID=A0A6P6AYN2_DURZI|nr:monooxygenase 1-like [Durio zibethinus]
MEKAEEEKIVIVGGGICGLATALALHRKEIGSIVLERSEELRATGAAIIVQPNGWRALDQLGIASQLRQTALTIQSGQYFTVKDGKHKDLPLGDAGEVRCLRRTDLIKTLAANLPLNTIHLKTKVVSIKLDPFTSYPILQLHDGSVLVAKVVVGCDGVNSTIANILGLNSTSIFTTCVARGFTNYEAGHKFGSAFLVFSKDDVQLGLMPVTDKLVYWFVTRKLTSQDSMVSKYHKLIKKTTVEAIRGFPNHIMEMVKNSDEDSLHLTELRYRAPWDLLRTNFRKGTVTVAGDAMHATGPFLAQGGSASLEDAVVLARCLSQNMHIDIDPRGRKRRKMLMLKAAAALDQYARERKMRVFWLSLETFVIGTMLDSSSTLLKSLCIIALIILFRDKIAHTRYDCGHL